MSPVTRHQTLFFHRAVTLLTLIVLVAGAGGLSLIWLRQQIADTARHTRELQNERRDVTRRIEYLDVKIAELHRPDVLKRRIAELGLPLHRPENRQLVALGPLPGVTAPLPEGSAPAPATARDPYTNSFDLAVMEPLRRLGD